MTLLGNPNLKMMFYMPGILTLFLFYAEPNDESGANVDASVSIT